MSLGGLKRTELDLPFEPAPHLYLTYPITPKISIAAIAITTFLSCKHCYETNSPLRDTRVVDFAVASGNPY